MLDNLVVVGAFQEKWSSSLVGVLLGIVRNLRCRGGVWGLGLWKGRNHGIFEGKISNAADSWEHVRLLASAWASLTKYFDAWRHLCYT